MKKVIPFTSERDTIRKAVPANPRGASYAPDLADFSIGAEQHLLLLQRLIGCTDVNAIIERFHRWATDLQLADGIQFMAIDTEHSIVLGASRHHSAQYVLNLDGKPLGNIRLCRRERFSEEELITIEEALGSLARALHSAAEVDILRELCSQDPLTGLGNRTSLHEWALREVSRARRHESPLAVMMIDIDHFKTINDDLGHLGGDHVLRTIANVLRKSTRRSDLLFRFGGDEFTILLPHTDADGAAEAARQIRLNLSRLTDEEMGLENSEIGFKPDVSIGIASFQEGDDDETLMQRADTHLYHAKSRGRARVCTSV